MEKEYDIEALVKDINFNDNFIGYNKNKIVLTNREISVLEKNGIDYKKASSIAQLLYDIDNVVDEQEDDELEQVAKDIADRNYYLYSKK